MESYTFSSDIKVSITPSSSEVIFGDTVTLSAQTTDNIGSVTYTFKDSSSVIQKSVENSTISWTPSKTGTHKIIVIAEDSTGTKTTSLTTIEVKQADISSAKLELSDSSFTYDGSEKTTDVTVKIGDKVLVKDTDYIISGNSATEKGNYTVTVTGKGNYTGTVSANWEINEPKYTVTVVNGTFSDGKTINEFTEKTSATVIASAIEGKKFSHWEINNKKISTSEKYSFVVLKNTEISAVYVNDSEEVEKEIILDISTSQTICNGKNAIKFTFNRSIPSEYTVKSGGIIYGTNKLLGYTSDNSVNLTTKSDFGNVKDILTENTTGKVKNFNMSSKNGNGTAVLNYSVGTNTDAYVYAVGYVTVSDKNGNTTTYYSDLINITYNTIS